MITVNYDIEDSNLGIHVTVSVEAPGSEQASRVALAVAGNAGMAVQQEAELAKRNLERLAAERAAELKAQSQDKNRVTILPTNG